MVSLEILGTVSYSHFVATMAVRFDTVHERDGQQAHSQSTDDGGRFPQILDILRVSTWLSRTCND